MGPEATQRQALCVRAPHPLSTGLTPGSGARSPSLSGGSWARLVFRESHPVWAAVAMEWGGQRRSLQAQRGLNSRAGRLGGAGRHQAEPQPVRSTALFGLPLPLALATPLLCVEPRTCLLADRLCMSNVLCCPDVMRLSPAFPPPPPPLK